ncbi:MAG: hypothetical protein B6245_24385 [Desulfobacteraceae bacterium 4572_88]|nr:MAG: hypothetical protein B6245_24385 [Desulfobacteraceae bacterium 4572_88]
MYLTASGATAGGGKTISLQTDGNGSADYEIGGLENEAYIVIAAASGVILVYDQQTEWAEGTPVDLSGGSAGDISFDFGALEMHTLSGTLSGLADENTRVRVYVWDEASWVTGSETVLGNQTFSVELPAGNYKLGVSAEGYAEAYHSDTNAMVYDRPDATPISLDEDADMGTLSLSQGYSISGTVQDSAGALLAGISVEVYSENGVCANWVSDSSGAYEIAGLPNGEYTVIASNDEGMYENQVEIASADLMLDIALGVILRGSVSDAAFTMVKLFEAENGDFVAEAPVEDGAYIFPGLELGDYAVVAVTESGVEKALSVSITDIENMMDFN